MLQVTSFMRLRVVAVLVGLSLVVVSQLGIPSAGATEPLLPSLSEEVVGLCEGDELTGEGDELTGVPEPEVVGCFATDLSVACLSVKQPDDGVGSVSPPTQELAPSPPGAPSGPGARPPRRGRPSPNRTLLRAKRSAPRGAPPETCGIAPDACAGPRSRSSRGPGVLARRGQATRQSQAGTRRPHAAHPIRQSRFHVRNKSR